MNSPVDSIDWRARAVALQPDGRPWVDGRRVDASADRTFVSHDPANGTVVCELPACAEADVDRAVQSARRAFQRGDWSRASPRERAKRLHLFADLVAQRAPELALLDSLEMGMPITSGVADMQGAVEQVRATAEAADKLIDSVIPNDPATLVLNLREPVGVVAAITPWNFPAYIGITKIVPALAVGNSVVLKPSEIASLSCLLLGQLAAEAGIPNGVVNVVPGLGAVAGKALALHHDVDLLTFTGSTATGKQLLQYSGQSNMKRLILECGGKSPQIVFADVADLDAVADQVVGSITFNSGQVCVAGSRLLVERAIHDTLIAKVTERARAIVAGDPLDAATTFGPLASRDQARRVRQYCETAVADGARTQLDGAQAEGPGCYWLPTVFSSVPPSSRIAQEEIFGPVLATFAFEDEAAAIALANGTIYGLAATVWTRDLTRALRLARELRAGSVTVGATAGAGRVDATAGAFEPHGQSGLGIEGGLEGMRSFTRLKSVSFSG